MSAYNFPAYSKNDIKDKRVLVRVDFNVPIRANKITDSFRIKKTLPLLRQLTKAGSTVILLSHLTERKEHRSFKPMLKELERVCKHSITLARTIAEAKKLAKSSGRGAWILLENLRVFPKDEKNDTAFAKELASLGDVYINEAFSQSHRPYASIVSIPKYIPSFAGPLFKQEVDRLDDAFRPVHPFLLIMGGVKFETKVGVLDHLLKKTDHIFIGGALANTFLHAAGNNVGASSIEKKAVPTITRKFNGSPKLILPLDARVLGRRPAEFTELEKKDVIYDVGPRTIEALNEYIRKSKMILWNGPLGLVEEGYIDGTDNLLSILAKSKARVIIGGGDTIALIEKKKLTKKFFHLSTGGGAMLDFLAKETLPGIEALAKK